MPELVTNNPIALGILMDDDLYNVLEPVEAPIQDTSGVALPIPVSAETISFNYLGDNNKYFLILVNDSTHEFADPKHVETLINILKGKQSGLPDIAVVNLNAYPLASFDSLKEFFGCYKMVMFGINPQQIGLYEIASNTISLHKDVKVLATYSFEEMYQDESKKRLFWNEMKKL